MCNRHPALTNLSPTEGNSHEIPTSEDALNAGLTNDKRVSREDEIFEGGVRVKPGPADLERVAIT